LDARAVEQRSLQASHPFDRVTVPTLVRVDAVDLDHRRVAAAVRATAPDAVGGRDVQDRPRK
jgi:hypothetical protein